MPRKKKHPTEWTTDEAMRKLFPKKMRDHLKEHAEESEDSQVTPHEHPIKEDRT